MTSRLRSVAAGALTTVALAGALLASTCKRDSPDAPDIQSRGPDAAHAAATSAADRPAPEDPAGTPDVLPVEERTAAAPDDAGPSEPAPPPDSTDPATGDAPDARAANDGPTADAEPLASDGDVVLEAKHLGRGEVRRTFEVTETCALGRVELDVGVDSMPDGFVTLTAPSGRSARLRLRALQIDFIKTWDWAALEGLHPERGVPIAGTWTYESRLRGADYSQPATGETDPMPTPDVTVARLRLFCEPVRSGTGAADAADERVELDEWTASWEPNARAPRPGAHPRTLLAVHRDCTLGGIVATLELGFDGGIYGRARLVAPDGTLHNLGRVEASAPGGGAGRHPISRTVLLEDGPRAAGIWELAFVADGAGTIETAGLKFLCSGP
ncbi:MAG: hypothetical protein JXB32_12370 [Deltaproteobacteria bacterium]|nr:hypothetical protein [Deltaproteobacteria bacterium]